MSHKNGQIEWIKKTFSSPPKKPDGWFTVSDISKITGDTYKTVADRVKKMLHNGELDIMECIENGKRQKCYRKKK